MKRKSKLTKQQQELIYLCGKCIKYLISINRLDVLQEFLNTCENLDR